METEKALKKALSRIRELKYEMDNFWEEECPDIEITIEAIKKQMPKKPAPYAGYEGKCV